jgi:serine/threonine protein kinase/Tol biopolymer transport system component
MTGQFFGHYRIIEKIGAGGMGEVFRARDERLGRDVALKIIRPSSSDNPDHLRRFEQEARAAAALNHPNILAIYDVGFEGDSPYIVSELLEGKTLRVRLVEGPIPVKEAAGYAMQIVQGLIAAHERHIVHRDLKPENLFITNDGRIKILDFGVAKLQDADGTRSIESLTTVTKHGAIIGTVAYMSPEQLRIKPIDHRSDIFSFGAVLYEIMGGQRAFRGETEVDTMTAVLREEPAGSILDNAAIPVAYQDIVKHCLEKEPENRFQSARDLAFALQTLSGSSSGTTVVIPRPKPAASNRWPWAIVALLAAVTVVLLLFQLGHGPSTPTYSRLTFDAGTVFSARFTPNGESVIYSAAWDGRHTQLFSTVANSLLSQPLQFTDANLLAVSRDNELALAMGGTHSGLLETIDGMLARAPVAGGSPREVMSYVRWADWSPNGKLAVVHYVEGKCRLEIFPDKVLVQSGGWISNIRFSPQGDRIAFIDHPAPWDNRGTVAVTDLSGHVQTLTHEWGSVSGLAWNPNGKEIWFTAVQTGNNLNLKAVNLNGRIRSVLDLPVSVTLQDIASDGRVLVSLNSKRLALGYTSVDRKDDVDLSYHDWNSAHDISVDGQSVLFEDASQAAGPGYAVVIRKVDGSLPVRLGEGSSGDMSPDGKWAISVSTNEAPQITLLPIGAGQTRVIDVTGLQRIHNGWARFLPNGERILVNGYETGHASHCYVVDVSKGVAKGITPEGISCGPFSPDGRWMCGTNSGRFAAFYSLDGSTPPPAPTFSKNINIVQWSSDGTSIYGYHLGEFPSKIYKVEISTGKETVIHELKPDAPAGVVMVAPVVVSRDGKHFAYSYNQTLSVLYLVSGLQ